MPGYADRRAVAEAIQVRIPTCQATYAGTTSIAAGEYLADGFGYPAVPENIDDGQGGVLKAEINDIERNSYLPSFSIHSTEVTNAMFAEFAAMSRLTGIAMPEYVRTVELTNADRANSPVSFVDYATARSFCRYWGLDLPSDEQWQKAARGAILGNPVPNRTFPWGTDMISGLANLGGLEGDDTFAGPAPVMSLPRDRSPYGVWDLAGNVAEWTRSVRDNDEKSRIIKGGSWAWSASTFMHAAQLQNVRPTTSRNYALGFRCASRSTVPE